MHPLTRIVMRPLNIAWLLIYFVYELLMSATRVFVEVMTPGLGASPRFVAMPLDADTPLGITLTGNLITLTPGTLTVDVSDDRRFLLIHAMYAEEGADPVAELKGGLERVVKRALA